MTKNIKSGRSYGAMALLMLIIIVSGCKKDLQKIPASSAPTAKRGVNMIPTPYFSWSTVDYMPTAAGSAPILVPWASGAVRGFTSDILYDYLPADGWELLYNLFDPAKPTPANPFFVLYNKYRSIIRIYVYVNNGGFQNSDYLTTGLNLGPNTINSNMLNYAGQDITSIGVNQTITSKMEPTQIANGVWFASQYEIAYDSNIAASTYQQIGLNCTINWTNVSTISLGGTSVGTIKGSITSPGSSPFTLSKLLTGTLDVLGGSLFNSTKGSTAGNPGDGNLLGLPTAIFNAASTAVTSGAADIVKGFLSGIFGGKTGGTNQSVSLTMNSDITLTGNSTQNGALWPNPGLGLVVPGTTNQQSTAGYTPYYNKPMGLFYLSAVPHVTTTYNSEQYGSGGRANIYYVNQTLYAVDNSTVNLVWNPDIVNSSATGVAISDIKKEVVYIPDPTKLTGGTQIGFNGTPENIGKLSAYTSDGGYAGVFWRATSSGVFPKSGAVAVRISFHVTPAANPAAKFLYVKTFSCSKV